MRPELFARLERAAALLRRSKTELIRYVDVAPSRAQLVSWARRSTWCCVVHPEGVAWLEPDEGEGEGGGGGEGIRLVRAEAFEAEPQLVARWPAGDLHLFACGCGCR